MVNIKANRLIVACLLIIVILSLLVACKLAVNVGGGSEYDGVYSGTYSGGDTGHWSATINNGVVSTGGGGSTRNGAFNIVSGSVTSSGLFTASTSIGITFSGQVSDGQSSDFSVSGTWTNRSPASKGTFSGVGGEN